MATLKRSWEETLDSDDDDEPSIGRQILPVANLPETFKGDPMDGLQYLWTVRRDSKRLPFYTRAENPYKDSTREPRVKPAAVSNPRVPLPSEEWRSVFIRRFRNFRKNSLQPTIGVQLPFLPSSTQSKLMPEKKERDKWWAYINGRPECEWNPPKQPKKPKKEYAPSRVHVDRLSADNVGETENIEETTVQREVLVVNEFGEFADSHDGLVIKAENPELGEAENGAASLPTPFATPQPEERFKFSGLSPKIGLRGPRHPTPHLLEPMDNRYCMHLLKYFNYWITQHLEHLESGQISTSSFSHLSQNHARWMFALLSRVDEHLTSDELSTLRGLARSCIAFIKDLNKNNTISESSLDVKVEGERIPGVGRVRWVGDPGDAPLDERACWMIVTIITEFWGQKDLWMDAESTLNNP